jgi:hypothetical protein
MFYNLCLRIWFCIQGCLAFLNFIKKVQITASFSKNCNFTRGDTICITRSKNCAFMSSSDYLFKFSQVCNSRPKLYILSQNSKPQTKIHTHTKTFNVMLFLYADLKITLITIFTKKSKQCKQFFKINYFILIQSLEGYTSFPF